MPKNIKTKRTVIIIAILALVAVGGAAYVKTNQTSSSGTDTTTQKHTDAPKQYENPSGSAPSGTSDGSSAGSGSGSGSTSDAGAPPAPSGQLLNKQSISLSSTNPQSSPAMESVCQTVSGATCEIRLTMGGVTKSAGSQTSGGGTTIIDWNAQSVGLTAGTWTVTAVATLNGKSSTSHTETLQVAQ